MPLCVRTPRHRNPSSLFQLFPLACPHTASAGQPSSHPAALRSPLRSPPCHLHTCSSFTAPSQLIPNPLQAPSQTASHLQLLGQPLDALLLAPLKVGAVAQVAGHSVQRLPVPRALLRAPQTQGTRTELMFATAGKRSLCIMAFLVSPFVPQWPWLKTMPERASLPTCRRSSFISDMPKVYTRRMRSSSRPSAMEPPPHSHSDLSRRERQGKERNNDLRPMGCEPTPPRWNTECSTT
jgi:hypothetical protein